jgi:hypothetical protein
MRALVVRIAMGSLLEPTPQPGSHLSAIIKPAARGPNNCFNRGGFPTFRETLF